MKRFGFIGLGNMGGAIAKGLVPGKAFDLCGYDPHEAMRARSQDIMQVMESSAEVAAASDYILLAVKPQVMRQVLKELAPSLKPGTCIISIAAGITIKQLSKWSGEDTPVVRIMPNTPAMVGKGVYAICYDHELVTEEHKDTITAAFASIGQAHILAEKLFDAYTGLIGSGPAYVFAFMEALIDAGLTMGLTRAQATAMVKGLVAGSALMAEDDSAHPTLLKEMVTSPGGTTIAGLNAMDEHRFKFAVSQAVLAAAKRSKELGE